MSTQTEAHDPAAPADAAVLTYREADAGRAERRARGGSGGGADGRGRRHRRRRLQDERRAPRAVRPERVRNTPICENGFLGVALGMAVTGLAAGRRDHVQRLPADRRRRDRQRAAEVPVHVRRPVQRPAHRSLDRRRDRALRHAALGDGRVVVHGPARPEGRRRPARPHRRTGCCGLRSATTTRCSSSSTRGCTAGRAPSPRRGRASPRSGGRTSHGRGATSRSSRRC